MAIPIDATAPPVTADADRSDELDWHNRLRKWLRSRDASGYGVSLALHVMLLILLSLLVLAGNRPVEEISTQVFEADPAELEIGAAASFVLDDLMELPETPPQLTRLPGVLPPPTIELPVPDFPAAPNNRGGSGPAMAGGAGNGMRTKGANAVSKGNFTVWTVPEDPEPGQDYVIVIEIKLPKNVRRYPLKDLSGLVVGTDDWRQPIPGKMQGFAQVKDQKTQLEIRVPGAPRLVKDTIHIRSRILKERQVLSIVF